MKKEKKDQVNILIVGAGKGGTRIIELFKDDDNLRIVGVVDVNKRAPGLKLAKKIGIPTSDNYEDFLKKTDIDEIINLTGCESVQEELMKRKPAHVEVMGGYTAKMVWRLVAENQLAIETLQNSEKKYKFLLDNISEAIIILNKKGEILFINKKVLKFISFYIFL